MRSSYPTKHRRATSTSSTRRRRSAHERRVSFSKSVSFCRSAARSVRPGSMVEAPGGSSWTNTSIASCRVTPTPARPRSTSTTPPTRRMAPRSRSGRARIAAACRSRPERRRGRTALTALVGDPALEVRAQEAHVPADTNAGEAVAAHRVVDPRDADGEECRRLVRGEQRLVQGRTWRAWVEFELTMQEELRSRGVGLELSVGRQRRPPADSLRRCSRTRSVRAGNVVVHQCESVDQSPVSAVADPTPLWAPCRNSPNVAETPDFIAETPSNRRFRCRNPPKYEEGFGNDRWAQRPANTGDSGPPAPILCGDRRGFRQASWS